MTAISLMAECKKAVPDATVFVLGGGRYTRVEKVVLSGVDPVVTGLTSVCLDGVEYVPADSALLLAAPDMLEALVMVRDADNDCRLDGAVTIPSAARGRIDRVLAKVGR